MKFVHLSDLHIGKRLDGFSLIEDQEYILSEILDMIREEAPDGVFIAGDVYDRPVPGTEAVRLFDRFITALAALKTQVFIISGNHDSEDRLSFGSRLMELSGVHFSPAYNGETEPYIFKDGDAETAVYMLPFLKPAEVRRHFPETEIASYTDAIAAAVSHMDIDESRVNLLLSHQFVTGALRSESEEISVGGLDNVDASVYAPFDYVALGHIHGPQEVKGREGQILRYAGTPLKYSFSEENHQKSVTVIEIGTRVSSGAPEKEKTISVRTIPLTAQHDMRTIRGTYEALTARQNYVNTATEDYLQVILTDEEDVPDALNRLRVIYPNIMKLRYDNTRTRNNVITGEGNADPRETNPMDLFADFYKEQNGKELSEKETALMQKLIERVFDEEVQS